MYSSVFSTLYSLIIFLGSVFFLAQNIYKEEYNEYVLELNASDDRGLNTINNIIIPFCKKKKDKNKLIILDGADSITPKGQNLLSNIIINNKSDTRFVFTCNDYSKIIENIQINDDLDIYKNLEDLFRENEIQDQSNFWNLARGSALSFIDQLWKDHLSEMDYLRSGIGLRAMGQRDPLVEYQNEGYNLFEDLIDNVKFSVIRILMNFDKNLIVQKEKNIDDNVKEKTITKDKIGRNDPCYCGSGRKYKKCGLVDKCIKKS